METVLEPYQRPSAADPADVYPGTMKCLSLPAAALFGCFSFLTAGCASHTTPSGVQRRAETYLSGGRKITVETFAPAGSARCPAVLVLHGSSGTVVGKGPLVDLCEKLAAGGKVAMLIHYFDRTGTVWSGDGEIYKHWPAWVETVRHGVDFAASHPRVRSGSIGLFGYSLGAYLAVSESAFDSRIKAVAELSGGQFLAEKGRLPRLPPLLILHGREDKRVSLTQALELEKAARQLGAPLEVKLYEDEGHVLSATARADALARALKFFDLHLGH